LKSSTPCRQPSPLQQNSSQLNLSSHIILPTVTKIVQSAERRRQTVKLLTSVTWAEVAHERHRKKDVENAQKKKDVPSRGT
jgi:hypothetical protein